MTDSPTSTHESDIEKPANVTSKALMVINKSRGKIYSPYLKQFWVFSYILFFVALSQLTLRYDVKVGVYMNGLAIIALLGLAIFYTRARKLSLSANILPVATLLSLVLPRLSNFSRTVIFYDTILVLALVYRYLFIFEDPKDQHRTKFRNYAILIPLMIIGGQILGVIGYGMLRHDYPFYGTSIAIVAFTSVIFVFTEEVFFRGLVQLKGNQILHPVMSAIMAILVFVLATITHTISIAPIFALILGTSLSLTYYFKQNLVLTGTLNLSTKLTYIALMVAFVIH